MKGRPLTTAWTWWLLPAVAIIGWGLLAWQWHWLAALGAVAAALLAWWLRPDARREPPTHDMREALQRELALLGASPPATWHADAVTLHLDTLARELAAARARELAAGDLSRATRLRDELDARLATLDAERERVALACGIAPDTDMQTMPWIVERFTRWHDAQADVAGAEARVVRAQAELSQQLAALHECTRPFCDVTPRSPADADTLVEQLDRAFEVVRDAERSRVESVRLAGTLSRQAAAIGVEWNALLARAGLPVSPLVDAKHANGGGSAAGGSAAGDPRDGGSDDGPPVRALRQALEERVALRDAWNAHSRVIADTARDMDNARRGVEADVVASWAALDVADVRERIAEHESLAAEHTGLVARRAALQQRIADASRGHDVEHALDAHDRTLAALEQQYDETVDAMIGHALLRHVQQESRDVDRPEVFHRARSLFARITHGQWELLLHESEEGEPAFRARDTERLREVPLHELSSGTRVQLLVAVRVAFMEAEERGERLPLFLDETLGTSDDRRAGALVEAVLSLVEEGRQVFYLTAQADEVAQWRDVLARRSVPSRELDMTAVRRLDAAGHADAVRLRTALRSAAAAAAPAVPPIGGHTHAGYRDLLDVPPVLPAESAVGATHLWYLLESLPLLHAALMQGITTWGPMRFFLEHGGTLRPEGVTPQEVSRLLDRAARLASVLEVLHVESAIGRTRRVDRHALRECGALSDAQLDDVAQVAERVQGDPYALLEQLEQKAVARFGPTRVSALREALEQQGHLDPRTPRTPAEIRLAMLAHAGGTLPVAAVDALLDRIGAPLAR